MDISHEEFQKLVMQWAEEKKADDIVCIDIQDKVDYAESLVICSGTAELHNRAIGLHIVEMARTMDAWPLSKEGFDNGQWILIDFGGVIVHIFHPETRKYYKLEELWTKEILNRDEILPIELSDVLE